MSNHLQAITDRARAIRSAKPSMKWTDAVKKASMDLGYGGSQKKVSGKSKTIIYAKPVKKKSGKTTLKVYARAKAMPKVKPGQALPPAMSVPRKPKPKPRKPSSTTYVTPKGKVYTKTATGRKRILGTGYQTEREWFNLARQQDVTFRDDKDCLKFIWQNRKILFATKIDSYGWDRLVDTFPIVIDFISSTKIDTDRLENLPKARKLWTSVKKINLRPSVKNIPGYRSPGAIKKGFGLQGISYKTGQPLLSLSGYPMKKERIFIGANASCCGKMRKMKARPKNVGELEKLYAVPEIEVLMKGRKGIAVSPKVINSDSGASIIRSYMDAYNPNIRSTREMFGCLYMNFQNNVIGVYVDGIGGQTSVAVDMQYALLIGLKLTAKAVIIFHNHPSGNLTPSPQDKNITKEYKASFDTLGIQMIDHIILSGTTLGYYSFREHGNL
jgi:DNA repair protein RadC